MCFVVGRTERREISFPPRAPISCALHSLSLTLFTMTQLRDLENAHHEKTSDIAVVTLEKLMKNELEEDLPDDLRMVSWFWFNSCRNLSGKTKKLAYVLDEVLSLSCWLDYLKRNITNKPSWKVWICFFLFLRQLHTPFFAVRHVTL